MSKRRILPGLNIQWPWSRLLLSGEKVVETRSYPIPDKHIGKELAIIETPGPRGAAEAGIAKAQIIGTITFSDSFEYQSRDQWLADRKRHCVSPGDPVYGFKSDTPKFGWVVASVSQLPKPVAAPKKRGIIFASECIL